MPTFEKTERRSHYRAAPRPGRRVDVEMTYEDTRVRAHTLSLGLGGAFIATPLPPTLGTTFSLSLHLPNVPTPLEVKAEARWLAGHGNGLGVKFHGLQAEEILQLNEYFDSLVEESDDLQPS